MLLQVAMCALFAQKNEIEREQIPLHFNPMKDNKSYKGYSIRLIPALPNPQSIFSYGFIILKDNIPVANRYKNSIPSLTTGIQNKKDAYKIAKWMINDYKMTGFWKDTLSVQDAQEIKIIN